jgi:hypothetical protein
VLPHIAADTAEPVSDFGNRFGTDLAPDSPLRFTRSGFFLSQIDPRFTRERDLNKKMIFSL